MCKRTTTTFRKGSRSTQSKALRELQQSVEVVQKEKKKMVHKKYTYKKGKRFGPYYYETKRENGKIITTYLGRKNPDKNSNLFKSRIILSSLILLGFIFLFFVFYFQSGITGKVSLDIEESYIQGEQLKGDLSIFLESGELLPLDARIIFELGTETRDISLREIIQENIFEGDFYLGNEDLEGFGQGIGLKGEKEIFSKVDFELKIFELEDGGEIVSVEEDVGNEIIEEEEAGDVGNAIIEKESVEEDVGNEIEIGSEENTNDGVVKEIKENEKVGEESKEEVEKTSGNEEEEVIEEKKDGEFTEETIKEEPVEEEVVSNEINDQGESLITGEVVKEKEFVVSGSVRKGEKFEYELDSNQGFEVVTESVRVNEDVFGEDVIKVKRSNNKLVVSTDYSETEEGFGDGYVGDELMEIKINLKKISLNVVNVSDLFVRIIYENKAIYEVNKKIEIRESFDNESGEESIEDLSGIEIKVNNTGLNITGNNFTINQTQTNITINDSFINETVTNGTFFNKTILNDTNFEVNTTQFKAVLGQPVKWIKKIDVENSSIVKVKLPKSASNISVKTGREVNLSEHKIEENILDEQKLNESYDEKSEIDKGLNESVESLKSVITGQVVKGKEVDYVVDTDGRVRSEGVVVKIGKSNKLFGFFGVSKFSGFVVSEEFSEEVKEIDVESGEEDFIEIEYETPAPYSVEEETSDLKKVKIVSPDDIHYEDVLIFTEISEEFNLKDKERVRIYWAENDSYLEPLLILDNNFNEIYDYVEWIAPHLSNQTFSIIVITKAYHLDSNRTFISDIFDEVKELDGNWSEPIFDGDYVRVVFERNLTSGRDITVYPRVVFGEPRIEVYEINGNEVIASFEEVRDNEYNKVLLTNLVGEQDSFDLRVLNGDVEFDHIVDPVNTAPAVSNLDLNSTFGRNESSENLTIFYNNSDANGDTIYNVTDWRYWNESDMRSLFLVNMRFDSNDSATTSDLIRDYSIYGNNGTLGDGGSTEVPVYNDTACAVGGCYYFDGSDDRITIDHHDSLNLTGNSTILLWLKFSLVGQPKGFPQIVSKENTFGGSRNGYVVGYDNGTKKVSCSIWNGGTNNPIQSIKTDWVDEQWYHIACVFDRHGGTNNHRIYIDSALDAQHTLNADMGTNNFDITIGERTSNSGNNFYGSVDELFITDEVLSVDQIKLYYENKTDTLHSDETKLDDIWQTCVTPNDLIDDGPTECSGNLTVIDFNFKPAVSNLTLNSTDGTNLTTENLTIYYNNSDADGDTVYNVTDWRVWNSTDFASLAVLNMPFDVNYSNNTITDLLRDYSTYRNNGTYGDIVAADIPTYNKTNCVNGGCYEFDGGDMITIDDHSSLDFTGNYSIIFWLKLADLDQPTANTQIVSKENSVSSVRQGYFVRFTEATALMSCTHQKDGVAQTLFSDKSDWVAGQWYHVACVFDRHGGTNNLKFYVNGALDNQATANADIGTNNYALTIGERANNGGNNLKGSIDEVFISDRVLSVEQIKLHYENKTDVLHSDETTKGEIWQTCVTPNDLDKEGVTECSGNLTVANSKPSVVTLSSPAEGVSTTDRTPTFTWNAATDGDGDTIVYHLNLTCIGGCSVDDRLQTGISGTSQELSSDLLYLFDNNFYYNWSVIAFDGTDNSTSWATGRAINISALVSINLPVGNRSVSFGDLATDGTNDTDDDSPLPLAIENDGNSFINITLSSTALWNTQTSASTFYEFKIDNYTFENGSFNWALSNTSYVVVPIEGTAPTVIALLNHTNATDMVEIDLNVTTPGAEGSGAKDSTLTFTASLAECAGVGC
jgi:hypothetical protein